MGKQALILAGGKGQRLRPFTTTLPKPLFPVGDKSILELVLYKLNDTDLEKVTISVGYLGHLIEAVIDSLKHQFNFEINYLYEEVPLGTAGPLSNLNCLTNDSPLLVINGDTYFDFDLNHGFDYYKSANCNLLIIAKRRINKVDYGVLEVNENKELLSYTEKPTTHYLVSTGIYYIGKECIKKRSGYFDMPNLILENKNAGRTVGVLETETNWFDLGRQEDFANLTDKLDVL